LLYCWHQRSSGDKVYVANSGDNTISVIDEATNSNVR
jgi:YVTN family beta-propeller protein